MYLHLQGRINEDNFRIEAFRHCFLHLQKGDLAIPSYPDVNTAFSVEMKELKTQTRIKGRMKGVKLGSGRKIENDAEFNRVFVFICQKIQNAGNMKQIAILTNRSE